MCAAPSFLYVDTAVGAFVAVGLVPSAPTMDGVGAPAPADDVVAVACDDRVVTLAGVDDVPTGRTEKGLRGSGALDRDGSAETMTADVGEGRTNGEGECYRE